MLPLHPACGVRKIITASHDGDLKGARRARGLYGDRTVAIASGSRVGSRADGDVGGGQDGEEEEKGEEGVL